MLDILFAKPVTLLTVGEKLKKIAKMYCLLIENIIYFFQLELIKQTEEGDVSNYQANGEFDLISFSSTKHVKYYSCCLEPYPDITYTIKLRRRPLFYVFNLILPCILINCIGK